MKPTTHQNDLAQTSASQAKQIKLGIDVHADRYVVRLIDGGTPQPPQCFTPERVFSLDAGRAGHHLLRKVVTQAICNFNVLLYDLYGSSNG